MDLSNIDSLNSVLTKYYIPPDTAQVKTDIKEIVTTSSNADYVDFSIDYSNDEVSNIINDIQNSFDTTYPKDKNLSIIDYAETYGKLLKNINTSSNFDDTTKTQLKAILNTSYDAYVDKEAHSLSETESHFINRAYLAKQIYDKQESNLGVKADDLFNETEAEKNIKNMLLATKTFYKNNPDGDKIQLETFLQENFSKTDSIEKLSYKDFKLLQNSLAIVNDRDKLFNAGSIAASNVVRETLSKEAIDYLKNEGASATLTDTFTKASVQNNNYHKRVEIYGKIRYEFEKQLEDLLKDYAGKEAQLEALKEKRKQMIEDYNKEMERLRRESYKFYLLNSMLGKNGERYDPMEDLTKHHNDELKLLEKQQTEIEERLTNTKKYMKETAKSYEAYMKNPAETLDSYFQ